MGQIAVAPGSLGANANQLDAAGSELMTARAALDGVREAGGAADSPAVASAVDGFVSAWSATFIAQDGTVASLAKALRASASAYAATDGNAFGPAQCPAPLGTVR